MERSLSAGGNIVFRVRVCSNGEAQIIVFIWWLDGAWLLLSCQQIRRQMSYFFSLFPDTEQWVSCKGQINIRVFRSKNHDPAEGFTAKSECFRICFWDNVYTQAFVGKKHFQNKGWNTLILMKFSIWVVIVLMYIFFFHMVIYIMCKCESFCFIFDWYSVAK